MCECVREYVRCASAVSYQQSYFIVEQEVHIGDAVRFGKVLYFLYCVIHPNTMPIRCFGNDAPIC